APRGRDPVTIRRALAAAGVAPGAIDVAYLTGTGHPEHDACELDLVAGALGTERTRLTALTPLAGDPRGPGGLRVAAAALAVAGSPVPALPALSEPIRPDLRFVTAAIESRPRTALVHGVARGGAHVALVLRAFDGRGQAAA